MRRAGLLLLLLTLPALGVDLAAPGMVALRKAHLEEQKGLDATRTTALETLISKNLAWAEALLKDKKVTGNIAGMATARTGIRLFTRCRDDLKEKGAFDLPTGGRRELRDVVATLAAAVAAVEAEHKQAITALAAKSRVAFDADLAAQETARLPEEQKVKLF